MTILTLLDEYLGQHIQQRDEYLFRCPFCHHHKKKLSINIISNKWKCWICDAKGARLISLLKRMNLPKQVITKFKELLGEENRSKYISTDEPQHLTLPAEYKPLWKSEKSYPYLHALTYLKNRGITAEDILRYRMGYCETGTYAGRIIVPSYDSNNQLNYFTARSFYDGGMKYKNPPVSKNTIIFENMIDWEEPIILCEGMFDAIALRQNAIPLMGKTISKNLEYALLRHSVENIVIFLDADARMDALKLEHRLKQYEIDTKLVLTDGKDASEMGFTTSWDAIDSATTTNFKQFIEQRLSIA
jgi:DNA primase